MLLLHGASGTAASWAPLLPHWSWADATALDLPGRGASPGPARSRVADTAAWLADHLAARGGPPPVLVGHSYGGAVGLQLALDHPGALSRLVLVSSSARLRTHPLILAAVAEATAEEPFRLDAAFGPDTPAETVQAYATTVADLSPDTARADWAACDAFDVRGRLGEVACPVLVLHGGADALTVPRHQARLAEALPRATRVEIAGAGHMLPWEAPEATARAVQAWLSAG